MMKPQDIGDLLKLVAAPRDQTFNALALEPGMSPSEVQAAASRMAAAGLLDATTRQPRRPASRNVLEQKLEQKSRTQSPCPWMTSRACGCM